MNPLRLRLENFRCFSSLDLDLPAGCVAVLGQVVDDPRTESNGSGKSTLLNAIEVALFGPSPPDRSWTAYVNWDAPDAEMTAELTFEHRGYEYRVRRGYRKGKATLDLEEGDGGLSEDDGRRLPSSDWRPLSLASARETQARLEELLGFTRETFRASSFLMQRDASAFTLAERTKRMDILSETVLGRDPIWPRLLEAVKTDRKRLAVEIARIDGRLEGTSAESLAVERRALEDRVESLETDAAEARTGVDGAAGSLADAERVWQDERARAAERRTAAATLEVARDFYATTACLQADATEAARLAAEIRDQLAALPDQRELDGFEQRESELAAALANYETAKRERDETLRLREIRATEFRAVRAQADAAGRKTKELDERIRHLESGELDECPTCKQALGAEARRETIASLRAQAQAALDETLALDERADAIAASMPAIPPRPELDQGVAVALSSVRTAIREMREATVRRATLHERLRQQSDLIQRAAAPEYLARLERLAAERDEAAAVLEALPTVSNEALAEQTVVRLRHVLVERREWLSRLERDLAVEQEKLRALDERLQAWIADYTHRTSLYRQTDRLAVLERAYHRDGIPTLIVENSAIPQIETEASRLLGQLGGPVYRVELRTEAATKDGRTRAALDVVCLVETGEVDYRHLSGGEEFRVDLALRLALAQLLAGRGGAESRLLVIDEPDGLDAAGKQALVEILRDLEVRGLERLYLISHDGDLRDSFDTVLQVVKENGRSRIDGPQFQRLPRKQEARA